MKSPSLVLPWLFYVFVASSVSDGFTPLEAVFYEEEPFIFTNKHGELRGMFVEYFEALREEHCNGRSVVTPVIAYTTNLVDKKNNLSYELSKNVSINENRLLFPLTKKYNVTDIKTSEVFFSEGLAVIVNRGYIKFISKLWRAIYFVHTFGFVLVFAIAFGIVVWVLERKTNSDLRDSFMFGAGKGTWLAFVTMTSVGYGDVAPQKLLTRFLAIIWMMAGLIFASVMVASISNEYLDFSLSVLRGKKISVLEGMDEQMMRKYIQNDSDMTLLIYKTYDEVLQAVRDDAVFAAVINTDSAAYQQDRFRQHASHPLSITATIPLEVPISVAGNRLADVRCTNHKKALKQAYSMYRKKLMIETIYYDSILDTFTCNDGGFYILLVAGLLLACGIAYDLITKIYKKACSNREKSIALSSDGSPCYTTRHVEDGLVLRSFDDELKYARRELADIQQNLAGLYESLANRVENTNL